MFHFTRNRDRDRRVHVSPQKMLKKVIMIRWHIGGHFCEDAQGRDGHSHASESKETLNSNVGLVNY